MQAFIVRPFGKKTTADKKLEIDFDKVEKNLIQPALRKIGITGSTTAEIMAAGNIREDMFSELLIADLVIADVSINNANVFYELGIRHALREKRTFLIHCSADEVPFDIKTDRYLSYALDNLAGSLPALIKGLQETLYSDRKDSPVFNLLPKLKAQNLEHFLAIPPDFMQELEAAKIENNAVKLALLAEEAEGFRWDIPALRIIGEILFKNKVFESARHCWERVRAGAPQDMQANDRLSTVYQRLSEKYQRMGSEKAKYLAYSDQAINQLLAHTELDRNRRAEAYALKGRNAKVRWLAAWQEAGRDEARQKAFESPYLLQAYQAYYQGFVEDLNHYYSGINALGLLTILLDLAKDFPESWEDDFDTPEEAAADLKKLQKNHETLATVVNVSINAEKERLQQARKQDSWLELTLADHRSLTLDKPKRVARLYHNVLVNAGEFVADSTRRQLELYQKLGVRSTVMEAVLQQFVTATKEQAKHNRHVLLFSGHMIDRKDREKPRFPESKAEAARQALRQQLAAEKARITALEGEIRGVASGACGGDLLFHEVCEELQIPTDLVLALPKQQFLKESVAFAGADWVERFNRVFEARKKGSQGQLHVLFESRRLPVWLSKKKNYTIWSRANLWMLHYALQTGGENTTLLALWNGKGGDGPGGTEHMVQRIEAARANPIIINPEHL